MSNLYNKYIIQKGNGSPVDPKAQYFVLRIDTDPAARHALNAYALFMWKTDPQFARELLEWLSQCESASNKGSQADGAKRPAEMIECGNCSVPRFVHGGVLEACPNCGDDETDLAIWDDVP